MKIIVKAEYECIGGVVYRKPATIKIGDSVFQSVVPRDETEAAIINSSLESAEARLLAAGEAYGG